MKPISQRVQGQLLAHRGKHVLLLENAKPEQAADNLLYLRFPLPAENRRWPP